jgi:ankyrin repeat protein
MVNSITRSAALLTLIVVASVSLSAQLNGERGSNSNLTPLMTAARENNLNRIRDLIAHGANVNERASTGETALYEAIEWLNTKHDNLPTVDLLLRLGADPNERSIYDVTPLELSLTRDHLNPAVTLHLLRAGASVPHGCDGQDGVVSLATQDSSTEVISALIAAGASPNCQDPYGMTALHWAAINGQFDRVQTLLDGGANSHLRNREGKTALDIATTTNPDKRVQSDFAKTRALLKTGTTGQS